MRKLFICLAVIMALAMLGGKAYAVTFGDGGVGLQTILNDITVAPNPNVSSVNVLTDYLPDTDDSYWAIHGSGGSVATVIIEIAQYPNNNTFGVYDAANPANRVEVFDGTATAGSQALLSIKSDGSVWVNLEDTGVDFGGYVFGYYLDATLNTGQVWYSDTSLNADSMDHMAAYQSPGVDTIQIDPFSAGVWDEDEYILAFEGLHQNDWGTGEPDYSDFVLIVESVDPNKTEPGICGDGVPDTDIDGDGTPDCIDECPNDPNKTEQGTCGCGIADTDADQDGIPACNDCDDNDDTIYPGAPEIYDGIDNDCDGQPDEHCYFVVDLIAIGQGSFAAGVRFGLDYDLGGPPTGDPNNWSEDYLIRLQLIDTNTADISDPNTFTYYTEDIRIPSGQTEIFWYVMAEISDDADPNQPGYYPILSWEPGTFGCLEVKDKDYVYQLIRGLGKSGTVLIDNMTDTNSYQAGYQDGDPIQYFTILWTQKPEPPPEPSRQIFPYPGFDPRALIWLGFPFTPGFTAGVPSTFTSGYAPGLSMPSFIGTHTGFVYPGWMYPAWTSYVPRYPATFPTLGIFSPVGRGWHVDYWTGYPYPGLSQRGWFYTNW